MSTLSIDTHRFNAGNINDGSYHISHVARHLLNLTDQIDNEVYRYYIQHKTENDYGWSGAAELQTLATLCDVVICVLSLGKNHRNGQATIQVSYYGGNPSFNKKFIYMLYDKASFQYRALRATAQANPTEQITQFTHDDTVKNLLGILFREDFHYTGEIDFHDCVATLLDAESAIVPDALNKTSHKRKKSDIDGIQLSSNGKRLLSPINSIDTDDNNEENDLNNKRTKYAHSPLDEISKSHSPIGEEETQDCSMIFNDEHSEEKIESEKNSTDGFENAEQVDSDDDLSILKSNEPMFFVFE